MKPQHTLRSLLALAVVALLLSTATTAGASTKLATSTPDCVVSSADQGVSCVTPAGRVSASCRGVDVTGACGRALTAGTTAAAAAVDTCHQFVAECDTIKADGADPVGIIIILIGCDLVIITPGAIYAVNCDAVIIIF